MLYRVTAWIWLFHILTTSVGLHVHRIYCTCTGTVAISLTKTTEHACAGKEDTKFGASGQRSGCCIKDRVVPSVATERTCCASRAAGFNAVCQNGSGCMDDEVIYLKLKTDLFVDKHETAGLAYFFPADLFPRIFFYPNHAQIHEQKIPACFRGPPIKPYGRYLLPYVQTWLC